MLGKVLYTFASLTVIFFVLSSLIASALQCVIEDLGFFSFIFCFKGLPRGFMPGFCWPLHQKSMEVSCTLKIMIFQYI